MPDEPSFTITVSKRADGYQADLRAASVTQGADDLRLRGIGRSPLQAVEVCLTELSAKAADGDEVALRFV
jgi:hypothetical protein